jgi:predicted GNAT family N-acyltransferase
MFSNANRLAARMAIRPADWAADQAAIATIRRSVFIDEQRVPEEMEWETIDHECDWFVAEGEGGVVGIVRLTPDARIGRMAVLPDRRGQGLGTALLEAALVRARSRGLLRVDLHAQTHAVGFYERFGFESVGLEFDEAGIPHRHMILNLREQP